MSFQNLDNRAGDPATIARVKCGPGVVARPATVGPAAGEQPAAGFFEEHTMSDTLDILRRWGAIDRDLARAVGRGDLAEQRRLNAELAAVREDSYVDDAKRGVSPAAIAQHRAATAHTFTPAPTPRTVMPIPPAPIFRNVDPAMPDPHDRDGCRALATAEWRALTQMERAKFASEAAFVAYRSAQLQGLLRTPPAVDAAAVADDKRRDLARIIWSQRNGRIAYFAGSTFRSEAEIYDHLCLNAERNASVDGFVSGLKAAAKERAARQR